MPIYTDSEFRTYIKCPRLYSYNKNFTWDKIEIKILNDVFTRISSLYLKNQNYNIDRLYNDIVVILNQHNKKEKFLESQYDSMLNFLLYYSTQVFKYFNINDYYPILGPSYINKNIANSILKIKILGVFRKKNQTLHIMYFSPYSNRLNVINDFFLDIISKEFNHLIKSHRSKRPKINLHVFYYKKHEEIGYVNYTPVGKKYDYTNTMKSLEDENFPPRLPCSYNCKYKNKCEKENYVV